MSDSFLYDVYFRVASVIGFVARAQCILGKSGDTRERRYILHTPAWRISTVPAVLDCRPAHLCTLQVVRPPLDIVICLSVTIHA